MFFQGTGHHPVEFSKYMCSMNDSGLGVESSLHLPPEKKEDENTRKTISFVSKDILH